MFYNNKNVSEYIREIFIRFKYLGFIYRKDCHAGSLTLRYKLVYGTPTLNIPLLLRKFFCPFIIKSRGEEYRIGNVGDLYFFTFWWIQWFAMLGNF